MQLDDKLTILADAAKYDVSCSSSGSRRKNNRRRLGSAAPSGICHTYTEDGRCVSLLKILLTNICIYDCAYCINRSSNDVPRAAFTIQEIVSLTIDFYRRNYIEGLFLSSGVICSPDDTMARLVRCVQLLRENDFYGYIHLKCVPFASRRLLQAAGRYADRLSVNIELPSETSLKRLTHDKTYASILTPMEVIRETIAETREDRKRFRHTPFFAPAGQSTQLIIGASPESDFEVLHLADRLYGQQFLKRVYYSAYVPVGETKGRLPVNESPPLRRENRLYQADWLMRLYGFSIDELISPDAPWLDLGIDPKQAFAVQHPEIFPVDINTADRELILKVPGIGLKTAHRIVNLRRKGRLRLVHLKQLGAVISRALPFILCDDLPVSQWPVLGLPQATLAASSEMVAGSEPSANARLVFETDGSFEGLLCAIFKAYSNGRTPDAIEASCREQRQLFDQYMIIATDPSTASRVWKKLKEYMGGKRRQTLFHAYLSGHPGLETLIYRRIADVIAGYRNPAAQRDLSTAIQIDKLSQKVRREAHRMKGFIRFRHIDDHRYLALIAPRYDVLPLIRQHFASRFADQKWIIYDTVRNYGICYDLQHTRELQVDKAAIISAASNESSDEQLTRTRWRRYYDAVNIQQRNNPKLHVRQLPRRYWQYLPEKQS
jgi:probable DNA metabolism protein